MNNLQKEAFISNLWALSGMILGPLAAVLFGMYFSNTIAKPVQESVIQITSAATHIASSGKQLEATMTQQVTSTNEVAATAKEIVATSSKLLNTMDEVEQKSETTARAASQSQHVKYAVGTRPN